MAGMIYGILSDVIGNRNVMNLKCSEAKKLVSEFYIEVEAATIGCKNKGKVDSISHAALRDAGLEFFG